MDHITLCIRTSIRDTESKYTSQNSILASQNKFVVNVWLDPATAALSGLRNLKTNSSQAATAQNYLFSLSLSPFVLKRLCIEARTQVSVDKESVLY